MRGKGDKKLNIRMTNKVFKSHNMRCFLTGGKEVYSLEYFIIVATDNTDVDQPMSTE